jgi:site-specific DNA recombinase
MKAIGYVRVSTDMQAEEGVSLEMQEKKIRQYCELNDLDLVEIIEDAGISAKNMKKRPGFLRALQIVLSGEADALVVYKLDRAFRSTLDALEVVKEINKKGRSLHSITERLDTRSAIGEFFLTILAALGQMERKLIGERTSAAMQSMITNGQKVSSEPPYGFRYVDGMAVEDKEEQMCLEAVRRLHGLHPEWGGRRLAGALQKEGYVNRRGVVFHHTSIQGMLGGT